MLGAWGSNVPVAGVLHSTSNGIFYLVKTTGTFKCCMVECFNRDVLLHYRTPKSTLSIKSNKESPTALLLWLYAPVQMDAKLGWAPRPGEGEEEDGSLHSQHGTEPSLRSSHSQRSKQSFRSHGQRSKQSFRSLKSGGDRSGTGQGRCALIELVFPLSIWHRCLSFGFLMSPVGRAGFVVK